jgi:hypothetical protein
MLLQEPFLEFSAFGDSLQKLLKSWDAFFPNQLVQLFAKVISLSFEPWLLALFARRTPFSFRTPRKA